MYSEKKNKDEKLETFCSISSYWLTNIIPLSWHQVYS